MYYTSMSTPIGELLLVAGGTGLTAIGFPAGKRVLSPDAVWERRSDALLRQTETQLSEYFAGIRREFDLPLAPTGTPFQLAVLEALQTIAYGGTCSYANLARQIGRPAAVRAVGAASGRNPLPIVIPCHRVIGSSGKLVGFGGGLETQRRLLTLEGSGQPLQRPLAGLER